jgi:23S rRNA pseudouridine1911/1915/1917 synthase
LESSCSSLSSSATEEKLNRNSQEQRYNFTITQENCDKRLDLFLVEKLPELSRSHIQKYLQGERLILVNGSRRKPHYKLKQGDLVEVAIPPPKETHLTASDIHIDILYEDESLLVINKQPGIPVHPSPGHESDTIVNALLHYFGKSGTLSNIGGELRPGIVHRLDKDTSGVLLIAKNNAVHENLSIGFAERRVSKTYEAFVKGIVRPSSGMIDEPIARSVKHRKKYTVSEHGREAVTHYRVIDSRHETSWLNLNPKTGRTHQIRVHLAHIGHPIIGDPIYARKAHQSDYLALFAKELTIKHPDTDKDVTFTAPYPEHFMKLAARYGYNLLQSDIGFECKKSP